jgi:hypothetical protein
MRSVGIVIVSLLGAIVALLTVPVYFPAASGSYVNSQPVMRIGAGALSSLQNPSYKSAYLSPTAIGDNDVYTAPAGRRAFVSGFLCGGGTATVYGEIKVSGAYYRVTSNFSCTAATIQNTNFVGYVLEPGESISANSSATGAYVRCAIAEYDAATPLYSPKILALAAGDATLYTVPAGKAAFPTNGSAGTPSSNNSINVWNQSGGTRTYNLYHVNSGGAVSDSFRISASGTTANLVAKSAAGYTAVAGDFFVVNSDAATATQWAYITVIELP